MDSSVTLTSARSLTPVTGLQLLGDALYHDKDALVHRSLIGRNACADEGHVHSSPARPEAYRSWLIGELVLVGLLGAATAYLAATSSLNGYALPQARLALDTTIAVCARVMLASGGCRR